VFNVITGHGEPVGAGIVRHPKVNMVSLTGDVATGKEIAKAASATLKKVHLELGGKNVMIILDDVDLDKAVSNGAWGSYLHAGQICMTTGRHLVQRSIADEYVSRLSEHANHLPVGDPMSGTVAVGPIIDARQRDHVHAVVTESVTAGARLAAGGTYEGLFYRPTVLADVPKASRAYTEEIFGPVAPVVAFDSIDEAVAMASDNEYGLSLSILTKDVFRGLEIADRIPSGIVHINDQTVSDEANVPFGGIGASGTGSRFGGPAANVDAFTETRWVTVRSEPPPYPF
jgi:benzaldehyde dehydrogenase (NAD)